MSGTKWKPELPTKEHLDIVLKEVSSILPVTKRAITLMCKIMKMQIFNDGNKRIAMLIANHELIKNGKGIISVDIDNKVEFGKKLIEYYEDENNLENLENFIYEKCLSGIDIHV